MVSTKIFNKTKINLVKALIIISSISISSPNPTNAAFNPALVDPKQCQTRCRCGGHVTQHFPGSTLSALKITLRPKKTAYWSVPGYLKNVNCARAICRKCPTPNPTPLPIAEPTPNNYPQASSGF